MPSTLTAAPALISTAKEADPNETQAEEIRAEGIRIEDQILGRTGPIAGGDRLDPEVGF